MAEVNFQALLEFNEQKNIIENKAINRLFNYVRYGITPKINSSTYSEIYSTIYDFVDRQLGKEILKYHNEKIKQIVIECYENIKNLSGIEFIDSFILYNNRIAFIIYTMSRLFTYTSTNYLKTEEDRQKNLIYNEDDISEFSMYIYKKYFFDKLQIKLFIILNEILIREERDDNMEYRSKIKSIMNIINYMDIIKPKIMRNKENLFIWKETSKNENNPLTYQKKWFEYFKEETIKYVKNKAENDIKKYSVSEYIKNILKYINEEYERQACYINNIFHNEINNINNEYLIENNIKKIIEQDTGVNFMLKNNKKEELYEVFELFNLYPHYLDLLKTSFKDFIKERGNELINDKELLKDQKKFIQELINLKKEMDVFVIECFENNKDFQNAENEEFRSLMKDISPENLKDNDDFCVEIGLKIES